MTQIPNRSSTSSTEDIFLELKLIAFRKRLEEENLKQKEVNSLKILFDKRKSQSNKNLSTQMRKNFNEVLPYSLALAFTSMLFFRSLAVVPFIIISLPIGHQQITKKQNTVKV